jgi:TatD DNase family protein
MKPYLIDTHAHLYVKEFAEDIDQVMERASEEGVEKFLLPAIDSTETKAMLDLETRFPGRCIAMMGLHPCYVKENYEQELAHVRSWLDRRPFAAVGEIGLDYYWDRAYDTQQKQAFKTQIEWANEFKLPIVIHSRESIDDCIALVKEHKSDSLTGIFHCFTGNYEQANRIIELGFYLGIGGVITYKKTELPGILSQISLEHLVLETDSPYLPPMPFRGKRNESSYLKYIAARLAEVKNTDVEAVASVTTANAQKIFGI